MVKRLLYTICLVLALAIPVAHANEHTFPFAMAHNGREYPMLVKGAKGAVLCTYSTRHGVSGHTVRLAISEDEGKTWRHIDSISALRASMFGLQRRPTTIQTSNGTLVCTYEDAKIGDAMPKVYMVRSTDNGASWSNAVAIFKGPQAPMQDFSSMAAGADGNLVVVAISSDEVDPGTHTYLVRSTDHGVTWSAPIRGNRRGWIGRACECCMTSVAIAPDGTVGIAFRANRSNVRDIHATFSTDGGLTFADPVRIQNEPWTVDGCPSTGPSIAFDDNSRAHISWRDFRDGATQSVVWYATVLPSGTTTPDNIDLSSVEAEDSDYPSIAASRDGQKITVVHESSNGLRATVSTDGGKTFTSRRIDDFVKSNSSSHIVTLANGGAMIAWMASRDGVFDVAASMPVSTAVEKENAGTHVTPELVSGWVPIGEFDQVFAFDLTGRQVSVVLESAGQRRARPDGLGVAVLVVVSQTGQRSYLVLLNSL